MVLVVAIYINERAIALHTARNISPDDGRDLCRYRINNKKTITHKRSDGANELARKVLEYVVKEEQKAKRR